MTGKLLKKMISGIVIFSFLSHFYNLTLYAMEAPEVSAESSVLICAENSHIVFEKNAFVKRPMASTTKIMTALLTLEAASADDKDVTITDKMVPVEGSSMYLKVGNVLPLSALAKGMLTVSGNDAANSAAIAVAGSTELFADMMNDKAAQIGMKDTHFVTPSGLDDDDHYSTAYDMALLGAYAMENESFYNIASSKKSEVFFRDTNENRCYYNENRMLKRYSGCLGIKTGFTKKSGRCLVTCAQRDKLRLIAVTLNAGDDWNDHEKLLDYGFAKMQALDLEENEDIKVPVTGGDCDSLSLTVKKPLRVVIERFQKDSITKTVNVPQFVYVPVQEGQVVGKIEYSLNGKVIGTNELVAKDSVSAVSKKENIVKRFFKFLKNGFKNNMKD